MRNIARFKDREGRTIDELLVAIAIITILVSLLLSPVWMANKTARQSQRSTNRKQMGLAANRLHDIHSLLTSSSLRFNAARPNSTLSCSHKRKRELWSRRVNGSVILANHGKLP